MNGSKKRIKSKSKWYQQNKERMRKKSLIYAKLHKKIYKCAHPDCKGLVFQTGRLAIIHKRVLGHELEDINANNKKIKRRVSVTPTTVPLAVS